jgi:hypothetical protein
MDLRLPTQAQSGEVDNDSLIQRARLRSETLLFELFHPFLILPIVLPMPGTIWHTAMPRKRERSLGSSTSSARTLLTIGVHLLAAYRTLNT